MKKLFFFLYVVLQELLGAMCVETEIYIFAYFPIEGFFCFSKNNKIFVPISCYAPVVLRKPSDMISCP